MKQHCNYICLHTMSEQHITTSDHFLIFCQSNRRIVSRCLFFWGNTWMAAYALFLHFSLEPSGQRLKLRCCVQLWVALVMIWTISARSLKSAQCKFKPADCLMFLQPCCFLLITIPMHLFSSYQKHSILILIQVLMTFLEKHLWY